MLLISQAAITPERSVTSALQVEQTSHERVGVIARRYADYALMQPANDIIKLPTESNYFKCSPKRQANEIEKGGAAANMPAGIQSH